MSQEKQIGFSMRETFVKVLSLIATAMILAIALSAAQAVPSQARRTNTSMTPGDILRVANVSDAQISPNGQWVVYTVATVEGDETINTLWLVRVGTTAAIVPTSTVPPTAQPRPTTNSPDERAAPTPLLAPGWNASNPRWSPDSSKIAFLANRDDQLGLWIVASGVNPDKREPRFIVSLQSSNFFITYAGESFAWAPDSKQIAYISATEEQADLLDTNTSQANDPRVIDRIQYKSRTSFSDNRRTHVWITGIDKPEPRQLTSGLYYDHAITFSPSGNEIAFLSNHETDPDANNNSDIFAVDLHGEVRQITQTKGCEYDPAWSPDGKWIAYTATKREVTTIDSVAEDRHVWVVAAGGAPGRDLSSMLDRRASSPRWMSDSQEIVFAAGDNGSTFLYSCRLRGREVTRVFPRSVNRALPAEASSLVGRGRTQVSSFSIHSDSRGRIAAIIESTPVTPSELFLSGLGPSHVALIEGITSHNEEFRESRTFVEPDEVRFKSFDGSEIQGWLIKPVGWREDRKYPLILSIHGGPHGMFGYAFDPTFQVYAARGYAVLYLNPRGSSGYGQKFSDGTLNEWGGGDYKDLMAGVDEALRKYPWIDKERMGVTGRSYGGFMTNWIITQTPRFKAAVSVASLSNLISFYSTSLYQDLIHAEFGGFPWDNYEQLWQWSPLRYIKQAQTPTMFIHGEQDNDVHITQAEEMYTALKRRGVETVLVRYPREGHGLREPKHRVDALERTLAWFDRYLK